MYHQIGQRPPKDTPFRGLTVHPANFKRQMKWLHRLGYRGLSMRDILPYIRGERSGKVVGITFDDGYKNVFKNALPVLQELGFTSTNYFVAHQMSGGNVWDYKIGIPHSDLMSLEEMRGWHKAGQEVGSHTLDHVHLTQVSPEVALYQIKKSKQELEAMLNAEVLSFCYPYGDESAEIRAMVQKAGYSNATTTNRGLARVTDDIFGLPRSTVSGSTNIIRFLQRCLTQLDDKRRRKKEGAVA